MLSQKLFGIVCLILLNFEIVFGSEIEKKSAVADRNFDEYPDYQIGVRYDEYPMIVPKKRTSMLLDKIMQALRKILEGEEIRKHNLVEGNEQRKYEYDPESIRMMDLQRRGPPLNAKRPHRKCYFNAVTCY